MLSLLLAIPLVIQHDSIWHHLMCLTVRYFLLAVLPSDAWVCNRWKHQSGHPEGKHKETNLCELVSTFKNCFSAFEMGRLWRGCSLQMTGSTCSAHFCCAAVLLNQQWVDDARISAQICLVEEVVPARWHHVTMATRTLHPLPPVASVWWFLERRLFQTWRCVCRLEFWSFPLLRIF